MNDEKEGIIKNKERRIKFFLNYNRKLYDHVINKTLTISTNAEQ